MSTTASVIIGILFGVLAAAVNFFISKSCIKKADGVMLSVASAAHMAVYIAVFITAFLLRNVIGYNFSCVAVASAAVMGMSAVVSAFILAKSVKK